MIVVAGLIVAGCVVAMLPAQESSRRRASAYRPPVEQITDPVDVAAPAPRGLNFVPAPAANAAASESAADELQKQLQAAGQQITNEYAAAKPSSAAPPAAAAPPMAAEAPAFAPALDNPAPYQPPDDPSAPQGLPETADTQPAPPPTDFLPPAAPAGSSATNVEMPRSPGDFGETVPAPPPPPAAATAPNSERSEPAPIVDSSAAGQMRSVLKRPQTAVVGEVAAPVTTPAAALRPAGAPATSARRAFSSTPGAPSATTSSRSPSAMASAPARSIQDFAVSGRSPALRVDVAGPPGITVGKPAAYVVTLVNESDVTAEDVQVHVALPGWVSVTTSQASDGEASVQAEGQGTARLTWSIPQVAGRSHEQLRLQIVTREGDAFELGVDWSCRPAAARAAIVVKQPQLNISLAGPGDMIFGEEKVFTLSVSNPGTGDAEQVVVNLSTGDGRSQPIEVGNIVAGHKKEIPLQVVANQAGEMELKCTATGDGGLTAEAAGKVLVRKAELNLAVEGPPLKYAGTEAVYLVTVSNTGNALADNVNLSLALPSAAKYVGGIDGAAASAGSIKWKVNSLPPGSERQYQVRVQLGASGLNRLVVQANASAAGTASGQVETEVEAVSDLKLVIDDPSGPVPTTDEAVYDVQVVNRGTEAAQQVKIVVQFGEGIEPVAFEGCEARIVPGQVICQPLPVLGAGEQVTLRIKAKPQSAGTHQFRVEVTAADGDTRLVSEGTTRFFSETGRTGPAASTARKPTLVPTPGSLQR
jgi:hypothetical protein